MGKVKKEKKTLSRFVARAIQRGELSVESTVAEAEKLVAEKIFQVTPGLLEIFEKLLSELEDIPLSMAEESLEWATVTLTYKPRGEKRQSFSFDLYCRE